MKNNDENVKKNVMDEWFKESKEAYEEMMKSAEKLCKKGEKNND